MALTLWNASLTYCVFLVQARLWYKQNGIADAMSSLFSTARIILETEKMLISCCAAPSILFSYRRLWRDPRLIRMQWSFLSTPLVYVLDNSASCWMHDSSFGSRQLLPYIEAFFISALLTTSGNKFVSSASPFQTRFLTQGISGTNTMRSQRVLLGVKVPQTESDWVHRANITNICQCWTYRKSTLVYNMLLLSAMRHSFGFSCQNEEVTNIQSHILSGSLTFEIIEYVNTYNADIFGTL